MADKPAQAFLSYAHADDELLEGGITWLRDELQRAAYGRTGKPFKIFMDKQGIDWGQHFPSRLDEALEGAHFFIPILSQCYFASAYCRKEAEFFLDLENKAGRRDLILPIYLIEADVLEDGALCAGDKLAKEMAQRQYADWREFAFELGSSPDIKKRVFDLAKQIKLALERAAKDAPPIIPEQMIGIRFWANHDGLIDQAKDTSGSPAAGHNQLQAQRVTVLEACERAIDSFADSSYQNTVHTLLSDLERYRALIDMPVDELDINELWCRGVALSQMVENAGSDLNRLDLPPLEDEPQAFLNTFIRVHTAFVLATPEGEAMQAKADRYPTSRKTKIIVFELMARLGEAVQENDGLATENTKALLATLCRRLDHQTMPEQHLIAVLSTCRNLLLAVAEAATGKDVHDIGDEAIDKAQHTATRFLLANQGLARDLASLSYDGLSWLNHLICWLGKHAPASTAQSAPEEAPTIITNDFWTPGHVFRDIDEPWCPEMVVIPAGEFLMGSPEDEKGRRRNEGPRHRVTMNEPFVLGRYPVTFEEFDFFCDYTGHRKLEDQGGERGRRPAIYVSWNDARAYCGWLSKRTGRPYRLPSEAEWEYACRAASTAAYTFGETIDKTRANFGHHVSKTSEVGAYPANGWGLHEMHGNVWEWCADRYQTSYTEARNVFRLPGNPYQESTTGKNANRVMRGGSWNDHVRDVRSASRRPDLPSFRDSVLGFRCAGVLSKD